MKAELSLVIPTVLLWVIGQMCLGQAFPDSQASWCTADGSNSSFVQIQTLMGADPDTVIQGQTYKRIDEYNMDGSFGDNVLVNRYYVRSDLSGKGFVMLLDSMQEYLALDVNAVAGDTVSDVLTVSVPGPDPWYEIKSVVVDSIRLFDNNGVNVTRQFVHALGWAPVVQYLGYYSFWQAGSGNTMGPLLVLSIAAGGFLEPRCMRVQDTYVFTSLFGVPGLPGIPCDCMLVPLGMNDETTLGHTIAFPNPSTGQFTFNSAPETPGQQPKHIVVYDAFGREVLQTLGTGVDLSSQPAGVYVARVFPSGALLRQAQHAAGNGAQVVRLVVVR